MPQVKQACSQLASESPSESFQGLPSSTKRGFEFTNSFQTGLSLSLQLKTPFMPEI
jgi:hypothetical protein